MYGIELSKRSKTALREGRVRIRNIRLYYDDGRSTRFVPYVEEEFLSRDDLDRVVDLLRSASNALEWGLSAKSEPATGPGEKGAV